MHLEEHHLYPHGRGLLFFLNRSFFGLRDTLETFPQEGIVFWRQSGGDPMQTEMAKIRRVDFGFPWPFPKD